MKILSAEEIREWDQFTMLNEPILSIDLMERAAAACTNWLLQHYPDAPSFAIFCGKGNNGGDGLAIARMLLQNGYSVSIYILEFGHLGTVDFQTNLARLHKIPQADIHFVQTSANFHPFNPGQIIVDALLGTGINRSLEGVTAALVQHINTSGCEIVSIDIPSGLFADDSSKGQLTVMAVYTLSFQCYKPAFLFAENAAAIGEVQVLNIGLHDDYLTTIKSRFTLADDELIRSIYKPRNKFAHKGSFGHALLVAGSYGKMGAAILAAKSCLRSGVGLLTCHIPASGNIILQSTVAEAMVITDANEAIVTAMKDELSRFASIGIGPGLGTAKETLAMLRGILEQYRKPLVLDADALNCMASQKELLALIPPGTILTPHQKEFERLFGNNANDFDRVEMALKQAVSLNCIIILKGHHSFIATPNGSGYFNSTGNAGMAKGGSGDVLTGLLTGLLAQGYAPVEAAIFGVYLHGLAGDMAARELSMDGMVAGDIVDYFGASFLTIRG
jgi:ADP-dependent NAD(P)H-hydrate dehydratase / NAD(P)H-hydrate epimerase